MIKFSKINWPYFSVILLFAPMLSLAAVPAWKIVPAKSTLSFTATQNGAPVTGEFKKFTGEINFDPDQLKEDNINIVVDVASISDSYNQLSDTLAGVDWFNTKIYRQAIFKSNDFIKTADKTYQARGTLTIRDKTVPVILTFNLDEFTPTNAHIKGSTTIKRSAFGVGQGEWSDTNTVKDDVQINFIVTAVKK